MMLLFSIYARRRRLKIYRYQGIGWTKGDCVDVTGRGGGGGGIKELVSPSFESLG